MTQNRRMEPYQVLAAFDAEVRRGVRPDGPGARVEADPLVVRCVGADGQGWSGIAWSGLDDANADAVIAAQVAYFAARGEEFEWKLYDYDRPPDLGERLLAAGFAAAGVTCTSMPLQTASRSWPGSGSAASLSPLRMSGSRPRR